MVDLEKNGGGLQMKGLKVSMLIEFDQIGFTIFYWKYYFKQSKEQKQTGKYSVWFGLMKH